MRETVTICPAPYKLTVVLLTLKVVSASHVTWATSVPILVFLGLSVLDLDPMYATVRRQTRIIALCPYLGQGRNKRKFEEKNTRCVLYSKEEFRVTRLHTANTTSRVGHTTATTVILAPFELHRTSLLSVRAHLSLSLSLSLFK